MPGLFWVLLRVLRPAIRSCSAVLLDGLQLVRFGGSVFEGVVLSARGISGEEADQVGAWRGGVRVSCGGGRPRLVGALSACGVSHRRLLRDAAIVLVGICLTQACAETTRVIYGLGQQTGAAQWALFQRGRSRSDQRRSSLNGSWPDLLPGRQNSGTEH